MQTLWLPITNAKLTASRDTKAYSQKFGFGHFGVDMVSVSGDTILRASGTGVVIATGWDTVCGNGVVIQYPQVYHLKSGKTVDVVFRYMHLQQIDCVKGDRVTAETVIGRYGNTGQMEMFPHLHLEADLDVTHPFHTPTVRSSNFWKGTAQGAAPFGSQKDTTQNPLEYLHCGDGQSYTTAKDAFIRLEDYTLPKGTMEMVSLAEYQKLKQERDRYKAKLQQIKELVQT